MRDSARQIHIICKPKKLIRFTININENLSAMWSEMGTEIVVPKGVFYFSVLAAIVSIVLLFPYGATLEFVPWLADLTYFFDVSQMLSFFFLLIVAGAWLRASVPRFKVRFWYLLFVALMILLFFCLEQLFVGDSIATDFFARSKIEQRLPEPVLTVAVMNFAQTLFGRTFSLNVPNSTPSDFVLRQWTITLVGFFFLAQPQMKWSGKRRFLCGILFLSLLVYVSLARVVRLQHSPLDVAASLGFGVILVWPFLFLLAEAKGNPPESDIYYCFVFSALVTFGCFVTIATKPNWPAIWVLLVLAAPIFIAIRKALRVWGIRELGHSKVGATENA